MLRRALDGLTVIDFTQIGAGPTCTMLLADMGAQVIKIEAPEGELGRALGPAWIGADSALFHGFNRNKLGVWLDLKSPQRAGGREAPRRRGRVVVESMRPGVMSRLGLGHDSWRRSIRRSSTARSRRMARSGRMQTARASTASCRRTRA